MVSKLGCAGSSRDTRLLLAAGAPLPLGTLGTLGNPVPLAGAWRAAAAMAVATPGWAGEISAPWFGELRLDDASPTEV